MELKTFGPVDDRARQQLLRCAQGDAPFAVLCADHHPGYSQPIGGAVAYKDKISPSGVGYDIACGNKAVLTDLKVNEVPIGLVMDDIVRLIGFGVGRPNPDPVDHPVLESINKAEFRPQRKMIQMASNQLGTVGSGNHYVDIFGDEQDRVWIGVHFGSRGFGHRTASGFLALAKGRAFDDKAGDDSMDSPPTIFSTDSQLGQDYLAAMHLAGEYAYAGRDLVCRKVLEIMGAKEVESIHNHHNFAWKETHFGEEVWVIRKGCTPAFPGQKGFVGATMGDVSVILQGVDSEESKAGLYSTVHGAGRIMSRTQAAGKQRWIKGVPTRISTGLVDWPAVQERMRSQGIELRGAGADEAPEVYKKLDEVLAYHGDTIKVLHRLRPLGVAMAGADVVDPYKD
ncbi:RtcB family protein [Fimbriimonas ginsengisoli]|uniref:3'-phosphate/5'-hydroxy nucleic acid ligase n=1 Tax=Fimbriimonas ginsengisoli Gsoil 348 TaxID=661478 RepID=A0A068NUP4_FIMGI|nr:RtcB family protein [Fimbriimonas ginsengisoli]AIE87263.1 RtcB protein [Fimbriimonas ginsengisoli Gsoil 348]